MADYALREYNINNDRMTYKFGDVIFDFKNTKAVIAHSMQKNHAVQVEKLLELCKTPGDFGPLHTANG